MGKMFIVKFVKNKLMEYSYFGNVWEIKVIMELVVVLVND